MYQNTQYKNKFLRIEADIEYIHTVINNGKKECTAHIELYDITSSGARLEPIGTIIRHIDPNAGIPTRTGAMLRKKIAIEVTMQMFVYIAVESMERENIIVQLDKLAQGEAQ